MTDQYDQRIDAMKARDHEPMMYWATASERGQITLAQMISIKWCEKQRTQADRNIDRLAAYKRKRAAYDRMMQVVTSALGSMGYEKA